MMNYEADIWLTNNPLALAAPDVGIKITALVAESGGSLLAYHDIAKLGIVIGRENVNSGGEKSLPIEQECDPLEVKKFSFAPDHTSQMKESCEFMTPANSVDLQKGITDKVQGEKHGQNLESVITLQEASVPDSEYSPQLNTCQAHEQSDNQQNQASCKSVLPTSQPGQPQAALLHELLRTTKEKECFSTPVLFCFISVLLCVILPLLLFIAPIDTTNQTEMLHQAIIGYNQSAESGKCKQPSCSAQIHGRNVKKYTNNKIESVAAIVEPGHQPAAFLPLGAALDKQQQNVHPEEPWIDPHPMTKAWLKVHSEATRRQLLKRMQQPEIKKRQVEGNHRKLCDKPQSEATRQNPLQQLQQPERKEIRVADSNKTNGGKVQSVASRQKPLQQLQQFEKNYVAKHLTCMSPSRSLMRSLDPG